MYDIINVINKLMTGKCWIVINVINKLMTGKCWMDALELALRCSTLLKRSIGPSTSKRQIRSEGDQVLVEVVAEGGGRCAGEGGGGRCAGEGGGSTSGGASSALEESSQVCLPCVSA